MMECILGVARRDERIRAAVMNGSRANPNAPKDPFQDYDIVYLVRDLETFTADHRWIDVFGGRIMLQMPETMRDPAGDGRFIYLMLFEDGNRIDLSLIPEERQAELLSKDSETIPLLDKDRILPEFPPASDRDYHIKAPERLDYLSCCNNFWWCTQNVAKGLWRDELSYAMFMLHSVVKEELHFMMDWTVGLRYGFDLSTGKLGKYYKRFLNGETYAEYERIYSDAQTAHVWDALFAACALFRRLALPVGQAFRLEYPQEDDRRMTAYLEKVRRLWEEKSESSSRRKEES